MTISGTNQLKQIFKSQIPFVRKLSYAATVINRRGYIEPRRRKPANAHRNRGYAIEEFDRLDPDTFKTMFRLDVLIVMKHMQLTVRDSLSARQLDWQ